MDPGGGGTIREQHVVQPEREREIGAEVVNQSRTTKPFRAAPTSLFIRAAVTFHVVDCTMELTLQSLGTLLHTQPTACMDYYAAGVFTKYVVRSGGGNYKPHLTTGLVRHSIVPGL